MFHSNYSGTFLVPPAAAKERENWGHPQTLFPRHFCVYLGRMPRKAPLLREAWHPQGPIHPQPHPVPLHVVHPHSHARRAVAWWRGGSPTCSGTGRQGGAVGPLWVPGLTARSMHGCPKTVRERGGWGGSLLNAYVNVACPLAARRRACLFFGACSIRVGEVAEDTYYASIG